MMQAILWEQVNQESMTQATFLVISTASENIARIMDF